MQDPIHAVLLELGTGAMPPFQLPPLSVIATWPTPNYTTPPNRGPANVLLNGIFLPLVSLVISVRLYTRLSLSHSFGLDDALIILAFIPAATFGILCIVADNHFGWNRHIWDVVLNESRIEEGLKVIWGSQLAFGLATGLTKASMLALTYRITAGGSSRVTPWILGTAVLVGCEIIVFTVIVLFQCQ